MKRIMLLISTLFMCSLLSFLSVMFAPEAEETFSRTFALPSSLLVIEDEAFMGSVFEDVVIPEGVESIGARAFADIHSMKTVKLPGSVAAIGTEAFGETDGLVIIGEGGSYAEKWAVIHRVAFMPADHTTLRVTGYVERQVVFETDRDEFRTEAKAKAWFREPDRDRAPRSCEKAKMHPINLAFP